MKNKNILPFMMGIMGQIPDNLFDPDYNDLNEFYGIKKDPLDGIDIEKEYDLIQKKESKYSRRIRDMIVAKHKE